MGILELLEKYNEKNPDRKYHSIVLYSTERGYVRNGNGDTVVNFSSVKQLHDWLVKETSDKDCCDDRFYL